MLHALWFDAALTMNAAPSSDLIWFESMSKTFRVSLAARASTTNLIPSLPGWLFDKIKDFRGAVVNEFSSKSETLSFNCTWLKMSLMYVRSLAGTTDNASVNCSKADRRRILP